MTQMIQVFVYGTLQPGEKYYQSYCSGRAIAAEPAEVRGELYHLPQGYPGLAPGRDQVYGSLLSFNSPAIFLRLDELEDYSPRQEPSRNLYQRERTAVFRDGEMLGEAWVYRMTLSQIQALDGIYLPKGRWTSAISTQL